MQPKKLQVTVKMQKAHSFENCKFKLIFKTKFTKLHIVSFQQNLKHKYARINISSSNKFHFPTN